VAPLVDQVRRGRQHRVHSVAGPIDVTDCEWAILQLMMPRRSTKAMAAALFVWLSPCVATSRHCFTS
jgi:hypothetical protein